MTKTTTLPATVAKHKREASQIAKTVEGFSIKTAEDAQAGAEILGRIKAALQFVKAEKDKVIGRLQELIKIERERWQPVTDMLEAADATLRSQIKDYHEREAAKAAKAEARIMAKVAAGTMKETTALRKLSAVPEVTTVSGVSFRNVTKCRVTNVELIPRKYMVPDLVAIKAALKAGEEVPGAELYTERTVAVTK